MVSKWMQDHNFKAEYDALESEFAHQAEDVIVIHLHWEHYAAMRKRSTVIWWFDWFLVTLETAVSFQPSAVSYKYKTS